MEKGAPARLRQVEINSSNFEEDHMDGRLISVAQLVNSNPNHRKLLEDFVSGDFHSRTGGSIYKHLGSNLRIYWHDHGKFIDDNGRMYNVRLDDFGEPTVLIADKTENPQFTRCFHAPTYDIYRGSWDIKMRFDFVNHPHAAIPFNTLHEAKLQRREGCDPTWPRHLESFEFDERRDSIALVKQNDGSILAQLHDSKTGEVLDLHSPNDVLAALSSLDDMAAELSALKEFYEANRRTIAEQYLGSLAASQLRD